MGYDPKPPYERFENYEGGFCIIDGDQRVVLQDVFAYDAHHSERTARMEWIAAALSGAAALKAENAALRAERDALLAALPNPDGLETLAAWFDREQIAYATGWRRAQ